MKLASVLVSHREGGHSIEGTSYLLEDQRYTHCTLCTSHSERVAYFGRYSRVILMAWTTWTSQQGRHHAPIQSRLHSETLLLRSSVLRALPIRQTGSRITPDIRTKRFEPARFGPLGRLWPDATSVTRWCFVLRQLY